jgi:hypothetical protein
MGERDETHERHEMRCSAAQHLLLLENTDLIVLAAHQQLVLSLARGIAES